MIRIIARVALYVESIYTAPGLNSSVAVLVSYFCSIKKHSLIYGEISTVLRQFCIQMLFAGLLASVSYWVPSLAGVFDAPFILLLGALAGSLPGCIFSAVVLITSQRKSPKTVAFVLCVSEFVKLLVVSAAIGAVLIRYPDHMLLALVGFFGVWLVSLVTGCMFKREAVK